jgi:hypothetical protein
VRITGVTEDDIDDAVFASAAADAINAASVVVLVKPADITIISKTRGSAIVTYSIVVTKDNTKALYCAFERNDVFGSVLAQLQKRDTTFSSSKISGEVSYCARCPVPECPKAPQIILPPSNEAASSGSSSASSSTIIPVVVVVAILAVALVAVVIRRRRARQDVKPFGATLINNPAYMGDGRASGFAYADSDVSRGDEYLEPKPAPVEDYLSPKPGVVHYDVVGDQGEVPAEGFEAFYDSIGMQAMEGHHAVMQPGTRGQRSEAATYAFAAPDNDDTYDNTNEDEPAPTYSQAHSGKPGVYDFAKGQMASDPDYAFASPQETGTDPTYDTAQGQGSGQATGPVYDVGRAQHEPLYDVGQAPAPQGQAGLVYDVGREQQEPVYDVGHAQTDPSYDAGQAQAEPDYDLGHNEDGDNAIYDTATPSAVAEGRPRMGEHQ